MNGTPTLWWGDPNLAPQYCADLLQSADKARAAKARSPRAEQDWRVSRALLQQARSDESAGAVPVLSISHARGHALVGTAPAGWRIGVDLEAIRPRDAVRLAEWCCTDDERGALARCGDETRRLRAFYQLWTLKESFIKAANLQFPADMRSVGVRPGPASAGDGLPWAGWRLRAPQPGWRAWSAAIDDAWIASLVWFDPGAEGSAGLETADPAVSRPESAVAPVARSPAQGATLPAWRTAQGATPARVLPLGRWS